MSNLSSNTGNSDNSNENCENCSSSFSLFKRKVNIFNYLLNAVYCTVKIRIKLTRTKKTDQTCITSVKTSSSICSILF